MINMSSFKIEAKVIEIKPEKVLKLKVTKVEAVERSSYCDEIKVGDTLDFSTGENVKVGSVLTANVLLTNIETHLKKGPAFRESKSFSEVKWKNI